MPQTCKDAFGNLWFDTAAGAALLCPLHDLEKWQGIDGPHYDAACVDESPWIFRLNPQPGEFYSLWQERTSLAWMPSPDGREGLIWRWVVGPKQMPIAPPPLPTNAVPIEQPLYPERPSTAYLLFDSIDEGRAALSTGIAINLAQTLRKIETYEHWPNPATRLVVHHLLT